MRHQLTTKKESEPSQYKNVENSNNPILSPRNPPNSILSLQKTIGNQAVNHFIQAKLKINQSGDMFEQEADRVADMVMRMPEPFLPDKQEVSIQVGSVQRKCKACQEEEQLLQAKEELGYSPKVTPQVESNINALKGGGQPLPNSVRQFFEPRLGHDFSHVRIHTDGRAAQTAQSVNALAFTTGREIVFGTGQYSPGTVEGKRLLAHELTHVMQQSKGSLQRIQRAELVQRATRDELLSALRKSIKDENWQEVATRLNGFNEADIKRLAHGLSVGEAANTRAAVQQHLAGWPNQQLILDSLDAGRAEVTRIGSVYFAYTTAIKNADWNDAVQQLNAMSNDDIASRIGKLKDDEIMSVRNTAETLIPRVQQACDKEIARRTGSSKNPQSLEDHQLIKEYQRVLIENDPSTEGYFLELGNEVKQRFQILMNQGTPNRPGDFITVPSKGVPIIAFFTPSTPETKLDVQRLLKQIASATEKEVTAAEATAAEATAAEATAAEATSVAGSITGGILSSIFIILTAGILISGDTALPKAKSTSSKPKKFSNPKHDTKPDELFDEGEQEEKFGPCMVRVTPTRGGNICHNQFAASLSFIGGPLEWEVTPPSGETASFDAKGIGNDVYEVKTGHRHLIDEPFNPTNRFTIIKIQKQAAKQMRVANQCGYELKWVFNQPDVAEYVDGLIEPKVEYRPFNCDKEDDL